MFRFLHAADIHLDSPLKGLDAYEGAPAEEIRLASRRALENLVQVAIEQGVNFVLIAGDLYDGDWKDYPTGRFFRRQVVRLKDAGIPVVLIAGNHDAANKMTKSLDLPDNATLLDHRRPQTVVFEDLGVAIHGQSFASQRVVEDLSQRYPAPIPGMFNIGMLHTCATGRDGHESYAPCSVEGLQLKEYDYWALGHIHQREQLAEGPHIVFPGNLQGRHIRETGPKGCYLVSVDDEHHAQLDFQTLDVFRWALIHQDVSEFRGSDDFLEAVGRALLAQCQAAGDRCTAVRVVCEGASDLHAAFSQDRLRWINEVRAQAEEQGAEQLWIEKVEFRTRPPARKSSPELSGGPAGEVQALLQELSQVANPAERLGLDLSKLRQKLHRDLQGFVGEDADWMQGLLQDVDARLLGTLSKESRP